MIDFNAIEFAQPEFFALYALIPLIVLWYWWRRKRQFADLQMSTLEGFAHTRPSIRQRLRLLPPILRIASLSLLILALARPQSSTSGENITTEGIDVVMAIDISQSMDAVDLKPNRLEAAKDVAADFIDERQDDRIGLVAFGERSFTQCPLTTDHSVVLTTLEDLELGSQLGSRTAIGAGLATAVSRLKDSDAISKVVILLTDGVNNAGAIAPLTAAEIAVTFGVRVYTIGIGTKGVAQRPVKTPFGMQYQQVEVKIDEDVLTEIAQKTDGRYFRATSNKDLAKIYDEIDQLEKTRIEVTEFKRHTEEFLPFALAAGLLLLLELLGRYSVFRTTP